MASDDIAFAHLKASEGGDFTGACFSENWVGAGKAGLRSGAYHYFILCRLGDEQAAHFRRTAPPVNSALPPAVDLELVGNCAWRPDPGAVYAELNAFLAVVETACGHEGPPYVGEDWEDRHPALNRSQRPQWLVSFVARPDPS